MRYKEWRELYGQQAISEGWMLHGAGLNGFDYVFLHWFATSPYLDSFRNLIALRRHVKHRAEVDKDPAAIYASQLLESAEIARKLCAGEDDEP